MAMLMTGLRADLQHDAGLRVGAEALQHRPRDDRDRPGDSGIRYDPSASVIALRLRPVSVCVTVTSTPGSTPPLPSFTVPLI